MEQRFVLPLDTPICKLECKTAFESLTNAEKQYLFWLSKASNDGALICPLQTSIESPAIVAMLFLLFSDPDFEQALGSTVEVSKTEVEAFLMYSAGVLSNLGNYKSFGDTKILPGLTLNSFETLIKMSKSFDNISNIWLYVQKQIYEFAEEKFQLSYGNTTYLSHNCTSLDVELVQKSLDENDISGYNTRLLKKHDKQFVVKVASEKSKTMSKVAEEPELHLEYGDYDLLLTRVNKGLREAAKHVSNEIESKMIANYILSFESGSIEDHKTASRYWVQNKGPAVEYYIGFIENYRDPHGSRAEFEGFVAVVNKERSKKFEELVKMAPTLLEKLPWSSDFEKQNFLEPDFTSLDIITFGSSDVPSGINIPNYDDIRERDGFKNLDLGNVQNVNPINTRIPFLGEASVEFLKAWKAKAWELQTALHELLGHGSGLLFNSQNTPEVVDPLTGQPVQSYYEAGETYDGKFASISSPYEECRAECVGLVLCTDREVLKLFGYLTEEDQRNVVSMNYLQFAYDGLRSLEFYDPVKKSWGQAHMQAAFAIMQVFMEADATAVTVTPLKDNDGNVINVQLIFDAAKINICQNAVRQFLLKLQVFKSTGNISEALKMFSSYSTPNDFLLSVRDAVIHNKAPRKLLILPNLSMDSQGEIKLKYDYPETPIGLIQSFVDRYRDDPKIMDDLMILAERNLVFAKLC